MNYKLLYLFIFSLLSLNIYGQNSGMDSINSQYLEKRSLKNEIQLNLLLPSFNFPEISYERFICSNVGLGIAGSYLSPMKGAVIPFSRLYFDVKPGSNIFIEVNIPVHFTTHNFPNGEFGMGTAVGFKIIKMNNWVGEAHIGLGSIFQKSYYDFYPRCGFSIGKRFGK